MNQPSKLAIGICTYQRPERLQLCLNSIAKMKIPLGLDCYILIADNDSQGAAKNIAESFSKDDSFSVYYGIESQRGIPFTRNNILCQAQKIGITDLAFIDDDEYVDQDWMINLWQKYTSTETDIVRGLVVTEYPSDCPNWIIKGKFHQMKKLDPKKTYKTSATNNVIFNFQKLITECNLRFDESFGLRGGSDIDFFKRAYERGCIISVANDAVVYEPLAKNRYSLGYLLRRRFRSMNHKDIYSNSGAANHIYHLVISIFLLILGALLLPISILLGRHISARALYWIAWGAGLFLGFWGIHLKWDEYK